ncbi:MULTISPECIES: hypothetical protein [Citrobacter]|uniref:Uncharacterized protein n=3 Tax=Citrobacter freundii complex TaxID=1344959 RepID=A0A9N8GWA4_9ENTR|nr:MULTISPECIES: hypothetical protein [Citrobacter]EDW6206149.1 hypothetical protein [Salmonella enterica subsp. enterica]EEE6681725.1 hypothetical protein [Salmonella enterica subsp. diarizonae]EFL9618734.1 hypothetical protein [Escherichia coli]EGT5658379.1 hypothetical protein [Citrobacter braakii]EJO8578723.1 hypothetical protein [Salmonella enterica]
MIDYVGRVTQPQAQRANKPAQDSVGTMAKTVAYLFPVVFTTAYFLNAIFEMASSS